jgi:tetratricopeptide (TPR) repeat protein
LLFYQGKFEEAIKAYDDAISNDSVNSTIYYQRGYTQFQLNKFNESLQDYNKAIVIDDSNSTYYSSKADVLFKLSNYKDAEKAYKKSLDLNHNNINSYFGLGNTLFKLGNYEDALKAYNTALTFKGNSTDDDDIAVLVSSGQELNKINHTNMSLIYLNKAIEFDFNNSNAYFSKANVLFKLGNYEDALKAYNTALTFKGNSTDDDDIAVLMSHGQELNKMNKLYLALNYFTKAVDFDKNNSNAYYGLGNTLFKLGKYEEALKAYDKALVLDNTNVIALYGKGHTLFEQQKYREAIQVYQVALNNDLNNLGKEVLITQGIKLNKINNTNMSLMYLNKAINYNPSSKAYYELGNTYFKIGKHEEALKAYDNAASNLNDQTVERKKIDDAINSTNQKLNEMTMRNINTEGNNTSQLIEYN